MKKIALYLTLCINLSAATWQENIPQPVFENCKPLIDLYWKTWEISQTRIKTQEGLPQSPYMDEACWDSHIWIWDTAFMAFFTNYSPNDFPGIESLKNFYLPMHDKTGQLPLRIQHPDNPPLFAWCEFNNWKFNNQTSFGKGKPALEKTLNYLVKHFDWFNSVSPGTKFGGAGTVLKHVKDEKNNTIGYTWNGVASGMDNTVRGRGVGYHNTLWIDAISQQALSALNIHRMAKAVGNKNLSTKFKKIYSQLKTTVNKLYWHEEDGIYYDIDKATQKAIKVITPASFWPMLAEIPNQEQAKKLAQHLQNPKTLGGEVPVVTLARSDQQFNSKTGDYWRGGIWLPTSYMTIKALQKYDLFDLAQSISEKTVNHMLKTYHNPKVEKATIWECYSPSVPGPSTERGKTARPDFCGWSALGPISLFIENILGFYSVDYQNKTVKWHLTHHEKHGIKNLRFGDIKTSIIYDNGKVMVISNQPYTLLINGNPHVIKQGTTHIKQ